MQCKTCNYTLWNLRTRTCPECGTDFKPSDFEFIPNAVRFCCPHCAQTYYGTDSRGQLVPRAFECVTCRQSIDIDEMVLLPAEGVTEFQTRREGVPWVDGRDKGEGLLKRWLKTIGMALVNPGQLGAGIRSTHPAWAAFAFSSLTMLLTWIVLGVFMGLWMGLVFGIGRASAPAGGGGAGAMPPGFPAGPTFALSTAGAVAIFGAVAWIIALVLWALIAHVILKITGPTAAGLRRTLDTIYYASGAGVLLMVPCIGQYGLGQIWTMVSATIMMTRSQKVSGLRASFAVLTPPIMVFVAIIGFYIYIFTVAISGLSAARTAGAPWTPGTPANTFLAQSQAQSVSSALTDYHASNHAYPDHAVRLLTDPGAPLSAYDAVLDPSRLASVPVGRSNLQQLAFALPRDAQRTADVAAAMLPQDVSAHRLGDFVFTYHGITDPPQDPSLWLAVCWPGAAPSPVVSPGITPGSGPDPVHVVRADGAVTTIPRTNWESTLSKQNQLRCKLGLPPIPTPASITEQRPARASDPSPSQQPTPPADTPP